MLRNRCMVSPGWCALVEVNRQASTRFLRWVWLLIVIGVMFRMLRYGIRMPIWGDEAMVGVNFLDRSLGNLFAPLEFGQVLPAGYLAISWVLMQMLGYSELVVRLLAMTSSVVTLFVLY